MTDSIWNMRENRHFTRDVEAHYRTVLYDLDLVAYNNCVFDGDVLAFRKSIVTMAMGLTSAAIIDPSRTREVAYNLNLVAKNIDHPYLTKASNAFNSDTLRTIQQALVCGLYRLESGRDTYDGKLREALNAILEHMQLNKISKQEIRAVETIPGRFDMYTNLLALMTFEIADRTLGTNYASVTDEVIDDLNARLQDSNTGLFCEYFQTGSFGFPLEELNSSAFWRVEAKKPAANALALCLYHHFRPDDAARCWRSFKQAFEDQLLATTNKQVAGCVGHSYLTELGGRLEDVLASCWCAKEFDDQPFFDALKQHFDELMQPKRVETKIIYTSLDTSEGSTTSYFGMLAQIHCGWNNILNHNWEAQRNQDYNEVR